MKGFFQSPATRIVVVLLLAGYTLANVSFDLSRPFGHPLGDYGFSTDGTYVTGVAPGGPAAKAGLRAGQKITLRHNEKTLSAFSEYGVAPEPGTLLRVSIIGSAVNEVALAAVPEPTSNFPYLLTRQIPDDVAVVRGRLSSYAGK